MGINLLEKNQKRKEQLISLAKTGGTEKDLARFDILNDIHDGLDSSIDKAVSDIKDTIKDIKIPEPTPVTDLSALHIKLDEIKKKQDEPVELTLEII